MTRVWFNTIDGELLTTQREAQQRIKQLGETVVPLAPLVLGEEFPYVSGDYEMPNTRGWEAQQCIEYGKFALRILTEPHEPKPPLQREHFRRLRVLGIGPPPKQLGNFTDFKNAIGVPTVGDISRFRGNFDDITPEEVLKMVAEVAKQLDHRVTWPDYRAAKRLGKVPSDQTILGMGGLRTVNALLGFPDVGRWEEEDFLDFGMDFLRTNGPEKFTTTAFDILSRRDRGPWTKNVSLTFGKWSTYKQLVLADWEQQQNRKTAHVNRYRKEITKGILPGAFIALSDDELLPRAAKYQVASECAPGMTEAQLTDTSSLLTAAAYNRRLYTVNPHANEGYIEMVALSRNLLDDMWPQPFNARIYVSDEEIETAQTKRRLHEGPHRNTTI